MLSRILIARITTSRDGGRSSVPSKTLVHWTLSVDQRSSLSKAGCKRQFSLTGVKGGYLMGARHHSANERNGKWTMRRAYSDENRHCAMWLTCKGMPVQHEAGISIQMFPRTWISYDPTVWIYAKVYKILGRGERFLKRLSTNDKRDFYYFSHGVWRDISLFKSGRNYFFDWGRVFIPNFFFLCY